MARQSADGARDTAAVSEKDILSTTAFDTTNVQKDVPEIDHVAERKLVRKLDLWIVPPGKHHESSH